MTPFAWAGPTDGASNAGASPAREARSGSDKPQCQSQSTELLRQQLPHPCVTPLLVASGSAHSLTKRIGLCHFVTTSQGCESYAAKWRKCSTLRSLVVCDYLAQIVYAILSGIIRVAGSSRQARRARRRRLPFRWRS